MLSVNLVLNALVVQVVNSARSTETILVSHTILPFRKVLLEKVTVVIAIVSNGGVRLKVRSLILSDI